MPLPPALPYSSADVASRSESEDSTQRISFEIRPLRFELVVWSLPTRTGYCGPVRRDRGVGMRKVISPRQSLWIVLVACIGFILLSSPAHAETKAWNLANEFSLAKLNPAPDKYGDKNTWYYSQGTIVKGVAKYPLLKYFIDPAEEQAACGVEGFYVWDKAEQSTPVILYNSGPMVEAGRDPCDGAPFATKTVFMHPEFGGKGRSAVARWKSPTTGTVTVSGSVQLVDPNGVLVKGISWKLSGSRKRAETTIAGPYETHETNLMSFGPTSVSVIKGEFLNLQLGTAMGSNGAYNTTAVSLMITSP
jgi:hypothetical protein